MTPRTVEMLSETRQRAIAVRNEALAMMAQRAIDGNESAFDFFWSLMAIKGADRRWGHLEVLCENTECGCQRPATKEDPA